MRKKKKKKSGNEKDKKLRLRDNLIALYSFLRIEGGEGGANLFSLVSRGLTLGIGSRLFQERLRLHIRKHLFTKKLVKHWNRLPTVVVNIPSLSVFRRSLDNALNNKLQILVSP